MTMMLRCRAIGVVTILLALGLTGCSDSRNKARKTRKVSGVAKVIDLENNYVSMVATDDKGNERELKGTLREDTIVWINGRTHKVEDIRPGDKVTVFGYREGKGEDQKLVATRVEVSRPQEADWQAIKQPIAKPKTPESASPSLQVVKKVEPAQATPAAAAPPATDSAELRAQAENMIYAQIRIKMEEFIAERAALLKAGRNPSDTDIRELEGRIMKARQLLTEAGEVVGDIEPPIVQETPKRQNAETPKSGDAS